MSDLQFTEAPWVVEAEERNQHGNLVSIFVAYGGSGRICEVFGNCLVVTDENLRANARLIAACPALYGALEDLVNIARVLLPSCLGDEGTQGNAIAAADEALRLARDGGPSWLHQYAEGP